MNSNQLLDEIKKRIRSTGKLFVTVDDYAGEFTAEELDFKSLASPAALVSLLGWQKIPRGEYIGGKNTWRIRVAVFVVTSAPKRDQRMIAAMQRAQTLTALFQGWRANVHSGPPVDITAENLHSRAVDKRGQALWLVTWWQEIEFTQQPCGATPDYPALAGVDVATQAHTHVKQDTPTDLEPEIKQTLEMSNDENY